MRGGLLVSLIDLSAQTDDTWDAPKVVSEPLAGVRLSILRRGEDAPRFAIASPDAPQLAALEPERSERYDTVDVARVRHVGARLDPGRGGMSRRRPAGRGHPCRSLGAVTWADVCGLHWKVVT